MDKQRMIDACLALFERNRLPCSREQAEQLFLLTERMLSVNQTMNLTAITDPDGILLRHYVDSATLSEHVPVGAKLLDVGCGAGFPTIPLGIFRPDLTITALDGTAKRIRYVEETCALLGLSQIRAVAGRAEELGQDPVYRERFDVVTARAVASMSVLGELCLGFARVGGQMIAMKSQHAKEELKAAARCLSLCGGGAPRLTERELISAEGLTEQRALIIVPKISPTPKNYPRHFSKISKKPL